MRRWCTSASPFPAGHGRDQRSTLRGRQRDPAHPVSRHLRVSFINYQRLSSRPARLALTVTVSSKNPGALIKTGAGTLVLSNANANTYTGDTIISSGTLELRKPNGTYGGVGQPGDWSGNAELSAVARWYQNGGMNANAVVTVNANGLLDLNGFNQSLGRLNLNDGGDAQTGAGR